MNDKELLVEPMIFFGEGECVKCSGPIAVVDSEITMMELNKSGIPINDETIMRCEGVCLNCGTRYEMMRWKGGYIKCNSVIKSLKLLELKDEARERVNKMNSDSQGRNPFGLD